VKCAECGTVVSIREIDDPLQAGRDHANANAKHPDRTVNIYEIIIRLRDGSNRRVTDANPAAWRVGERVSVIDSKALAAR
jgi:hypothetical protein